MIDYDLTERRRGQKYGGYLIVVTDSRGKIVDHETSHKWLFEKKRGQSSEISIYGEGLMVA